MNAYDLQHVREEPLRTRSEAKNSVAMPKDVHDWGYRKN